MTLRAPSPAHRLHHPLPVTPTTLYGHPHLLAGIIAVLAFLAAAAILTKGGLLLTWDKPIQQWIEDNRSQELNKFFLTVSGLGSTSTVVLCGPILVALATLRCRAVGLTIALAILSRPLIEFTLKELVERDRPNFDRLVGGVGYSFPSGHPMAAIALWGLLPVVVALYTSRRSIWWASFVTSVTMILLIAASRTYLGVHWLSDVVAGILVGGVFLVGVEWVYHRAHHHRPCCGHGHAHAETPELVEAGHS